MHIAKQRETKHLISKERAEKVEWTRKVNQRLLKQKEGNSLHLKNGWTRSVYKDTGKTEAPQKVHIQGICK